MIRSSAARSRGSPRRIDRERLHSLFDGLLTVFAVLVLPSMLLEAFADPGEALWVVAGTGLDWFIWVGFALSVVGILIVAPNRRRAARSHALDILLVVVTPPIVPEAWQALRAIRALRLIRLLLAGFRLHRHMRRLSRKTIVGPAALVLIVVQLAAATTVRILEPDRVLSVGQGLWWAISRATALGDGGITLATPGGRAVEIVVVLSGLAFLSLITAAIATIFVQAEEPKDPEMPKLAEIIERLDRIERRLGSAERG